MIKKMIPLFKVHMPAMVDEELLKVLHSGYIGQGVKVDKFEDILKDWLGNEYVLTLNNGTAGLHLALRLADVGPGDEVIATPLTCTASNMPILAAGARVVWADVDPQTGNIDPESIKSKITKKTKAILCVHWGGIPCDMDAIREVAKRHGLIIIEDGAHAFGAEYKDEKIGNHGDFVMFSLQAIKHITTIDGGLLCCKDEGQYRRGKLLRWYGIDREVPDEDMRCKYDIAEWGYKFHMNDISAVIGIEQMNHIDSILFKHRRNALYYITEIQARQLKKVKLLKYDLENIKPSFWLFTILVDGRDDFIKFMRTKKVHTSRVHARNDKHTCFAQFACDNLPGVDEFDAKQVSIPVGWWVTEKDREYIMDCMEEWDKKGA